MSRDRLLVGLTLLQAERIMLEAILDDWMEDDEVFDALQRRHAEVMYERRLYAKRLRMDLL